MTARPRSLLHGLHPRTEHLVITVLTRGALALFILTVFAGLVVAPLTTSLIGAPIAAVLLVGLLVSAYRSLTDAWPTTGTLRVTAAIGWGLPLHFAGADALGTVGEAVTAVLILAGAVLALHVLTRDDTLE
jgi:hypothetical protein